MLFNSLIFVVFGLIFFLVWKWAKHNTQSRLIWITLASLFFYGWWDWRFLFLIILSGLIDYYAGLFMIRYPSKRKIFLFLSVTGNLLSLSVFKYSGFVAENINHLLTIYGIHSNLLTDVPQFFLITPVGISFYTFQSMSYTIDVYRGELKPTRNLWHFFAYLTLFPQLVAGPIVRARDLLPQLLAPFNKQPETWKGTQLIIRGYFKKMVIADNLAPIVNAAFGQHIISGSSNYWWAIITAFAFQIYCDFSGYTDIARGLGKWMGFEIPKNFNHPYLASSLKEFWQRWHISLSTWFRDYLYIPLGGNKTSKIKSHINMWITMLLSGLWHGANWTFLIWGLWHALFLSLERVLSKIMHPFEEIIIHVPGAKTLYKFISIISILVITWCGWVIFRAENIEQAIQIIRIMFEFRFTSNPTLTLDYWFFIGAMVIRELIVLFNLKTLVPNNNLFFDSLEIVFYGLLVAVILFFRGPGSQFIYFQF